MATIDLVKLLTMQIATLLALEASMKCAVVMESGELAPSYHCLEMSLVGTATPRTRLVHILTPVYSGSTAWVATQKDLKLVL